MGHSQQRSLIKMPRKQLQSNRQLLVTLAAGNRYPRNARKIRGYCIDIGEIHRERIIDLPAQPERGRGASRRSNYIHFLESLIKVASEQRAHFLCLQIVSVIVS